MRRLTRRIGACALAAAAVLGGMPSGATEAADGRWRLYKLGRSSTFQRGCFPPCMCPLLETTPLRGTFRLRLLGIGDVFDFYEVRDVRWQARSNLDALPIRGAGLYRISAVAGLQQLALDLAIGDEPLASYDSGDVALAAKFPALEAAISLHGGFCFDTVLDVRARPAPRLRVERWGLEWDSDAEATDGYEVVAGDLGRLREERGAFDVATLECLADGFLATVLPYPDDPAPGTGWWFLMRIEGEAFEDGDPAQPAAPDAGISASPAACP